MSWWQRGLFGLSLTLSLTVAIVTDQGTDVNTASSNQKQVLPIVDQSETEDQGHKCLIILQS